MWQFGSRARALFVGSLTSAGIFLACAAYGQEGDAAGAGELVETVPIPDHSNLYMIAGAGQNVLVQTGSDGTVVVDAGSSQASAQLLAAIKKLTNQPIRYVIDTSAAADVVGGNGVLAQSGRNIYDTGVAPIRFGPDSVSTATILASPGVVFRVSAPTGQTAPFPTSDWPSQTFETNRYYIYANHEGIELYRQAAHDDTNLMAFFRGSDVIAAGDIIDADRFPIIDVKHGGSIQGEIDVLNHILVLSDTPMPFIWGGGGTYIIPAYGRIYQQADVVQYRDMMVELAGTIQDMIKRKMTLQQIEAANPCLPYEGEYGRDSGPWTTNDFVQAVYQSLTAPKPASKGRAADGED